MTAQIGDIVTYTDLLHTSNTNYENKYLVLNTKQNSSLEVLRNVSYELLNLNNYEVEFIKVWDHNNGFEYQIHVQETTWEDYIKTWYIWLFYKKF